MENKKKGEKEMDKGKIPITERMRKVRQEKDEHKKEMAKLYGVEGNPKLDKCYEIAWDLGHSNGFHEVHVHFVELVELIK